MVKSAIVTGAARGIGKAIAEKLYQANFAVVLMDVNESVRLTAEKFSEQERVHSIVADIRSSQAVKNVMEDVFKKFSRIDCLVNVAGTCHRNSFEETTLEDWDIDVATNMTGTFLMCQAAIFPYMKQQQFGRIVNIASVSGKVGGVGPVHEDGSGGRSGIAYAASKAGVINLTRWIARETGKWGITCNSIAPGPITSDMTTGHEYHLEGMPIPRWGITEDIAEATEFLLKESSSFITGVCLNVDGGLVMA